MTPDPTEIERLNREIQNLESIRDNLTKQIKLVKAHRDRLLVNSGRRTTGNHPRKTDDFVSRIQLRPYVERWLELFERQHGRGGMSMLGEICNVSPTTIKNILEREEQRWVTLTIVDKLLRGMGMEHVIHELDVILMEEGPWRNMPIIPEPPPSHYEED